jgi:hypothetical protein
MSSPVAHRPGDMHGVRTCADYSTELQFLTSWIKDAKRARIIPTTISAAVRTTVHFHKVLKLYSTISQRGDSRGSILTSLYRQSMLRQMETMASQSQYRRAAMKTTLHHTVPTFYLITPCLPRPALQEARMAAGYLHIVAALLRMLKDL